MAGWKEGGGWLWRWVAMEGKVEVQVAVEGSWRAGRETGVFAWLVGWLRRLRGRERTRRHGRGAGLDQLVVGRAESLGEVGDGGEALGVEGGQAECGPPDVELQHHFGRFVWLMDVCLLIGRSVAPR